MALCLQRPLVTLSSAGPVKLGSLQTEGHSGQRTRLGSLHTEGHGQRTRLLRSRAPSSGPIRRTSLGARCVLQQPSSRDQKTSFPPSQNLPELLPDFDIRDHVPVEEDGWKVIPDIWTTAVQKFPDAPALFDPHRPGQPKFTYRELNEAITCFAEGLKSLGLSKGESVSLLSENSYRWLIADQGVMKCGACDAVRGTRSSDKELQYIVAHADSAGVIVENEETLQRIRPLLEDQECCPPLKFVVVLWPKGEVGPTSNGGGHTEASAGLEAHGAGLRCPVLSFQSVLDEGRSRMHNTAIPKSEVVIREDDIATMVFTSGTTGEPKAVMLTHANLMHQVRAFQWVLPVEAGDRLLSLLPPWHMYERSCEYYALSRGVEQVYSGVKTFKEDLTKYPPDLFIAVPLVFDVLYSGVQRKLAAASAFRVAVAQWLISASLAFMDALRKWRGLALPSTNEASEKEGGKSEAESRVKAAADVIISGALALLLWPLHQLASKLVYSKVKAAIPIRKVAITGGGSLPTHIDRFFEAMGLTLLNGYGLTETSPVLAVRRPGHNVLGTVGTPIYATQIKVVDPDTGATLADGEKGIVKGKGPQVMKGYYKNPAATSTAIDADGWFDTGDLGWVSPETPFGPSRNCGRQLVLEGRAKDTIVLANGENVEPAFVEEAVMCSPVISQIMVIGQDQRRLSALIVPSKEELEAQVMRQRVVSGTARDGPATEGERREVVKEELKKCLQAAGAGTNERIGHFALLDDPFSAENGLLTATMKMKRDVIYKKYGEVFKSLMEF